MKKFFGLDEFLTPVVKNSFLSQTWPKNSLFLPADKNKLKFWSNVKVLENLEALVKHRHKKVRACLPDFDDEYSSIHVDPSDAIKAFNNNMTLVFDSMENEDETIAGSLAQIRSDLGLVTGGTENNLCKARSIVYATPAGCGTRLHFDANINFILQLQGSKRWTLSENKSVVNPTERFTAGAFEMSASLEKQCHAPLLDQLPSDSLEYLMKPGCALFVPRGYWHETTTDEDSISLNFTFSQPTWADIFTKTFQQHLLTLPEWRGLADGLGGKGPRLQSGILEFEKMLKKVAAELPRLSATTLLKDSGISESEI